MAQFLGHHFFVPRLWTSCTSVTARCTTYAHNNSISWPQQQLGVQRQGTLSFEDAEIDFTEMKPTSGSKKVFANSAMHLFRLGTDYL